LRSELFRWILALALTFTTIVVMASAIYSKPVDAKKTGKSCTFCHTKRGSKELTEAGKYYKANGTLDGYRPNR
jgi:hypothetical protein